MKSASLESSCELQDRLGDDLQLPGRSSEQGLGLERLLIIRMM